jgi:hypothetical protein
MEKVEKYKEIVLEEMKYRGGATSVDKIMKRHLIVNEEKTDFLILSMGWRNDVFIHHVVYHIQIKGEKIWILQNNTDVDLGELFEDEGVPRQDIVIGFLNEAEREMSKYAVA